MKTSEKAGVAVWTFLALIISSLLGPHYSTPSWKVLGRYELA